MAKETFHRTKPHVNVGTITKVFEDTSGELVLDARGSEEQGDPDAPVVLLFSAPTSSSPQSVIVAFPIDEEFQYFPLRDLPFESMEWTVDVMPRDISGAQLHVTMAVWQDKPFVATGSGELVGPGVLVADRLGHDLERGRFHGD